MKETKFRIWIPYVRMMMHPKDIITIHEEMISGATIGQMKQWLYLQYIGLKDKNGGEIYEGDTAKYFNRTGYIVYDEKRAAYCLYTAEDNVFVQLLNTVVRDLEITGNIYINPELK